MNAYEYTNTLIESLIIYKNNNNFHCIYSDECDMYHGIEGCLRLAREYGYVLKCLGVKYQDDIIEESYIILCYRYYQCEPPLALNEWCSEIYKVF